MKISREIIRKAALQPARRLKNKSQKLLVEKRGSKEGRKEARKEEQVKKTEKQEAQGR